VCIPSLLMILRCISCVYPITTNDIEVYQLCVSNHYYNDIEYPITTNDLDYRVSLGVMCDSYQS